MTYEELQERCVALQRACDEEQARLKKLYAMEHNPVEYGDIVTDHYHAVKVKRMSVYGHPKPFMVYKGTELTKRGVPKKRQPVPGNPVFQRDMILINGKPYRFEEE